MAESYSVTAVLSAQDKNFSSVFGSAQSAADSLAGKLKSGLGFGVLVGIGQKAFSSITSAASGFTSELENTSAAWQTFTARLIWRLLMHSWTLSVLSLRNHLLKVSAESLRLRRTLLRL